MQNAHRTPRFLAAALGLAVAGAAAAFPSAATAQEAAVNQPASYTAAQADSGKVVYLATCARCHGDDMAGGDGGPALTGGPFAYSWEGKRVGSLLNFVKANMPMSNPGSLNDRSTAAVVAYMLAVNRIPAGSVPLMVGAAGVVVVPPGGEER